MIMSTYIIMHNMIIEDEFDTHKSIVNLNVMFIDRKQNKTISMVLYSP